MWNHIINIHLSELLNLKTKCFKKKVQKPKSLKQINHKKKCFTIIKKYIWTIYINHNNILTKFFKELTKYKNNYQ